MKRNDTHIWFKLSSNHFNFDKDLYLCVCYIPPSNSSRQGLNEFNPYDELMNNILYLQENTNENCNFMIVGDLNSRIRQELDYVSDDRDIYMNVLPDDYVPDEKLERKSQDLITNANGYLLIYFLKQF